MQDRAEAIEAQRRARALERIKAVAENEQDIRAIETEIEMQAVIERRLQERLKGADGAAAAEAERIPTLDHKVTGGDQVKIGKITADVIDVPAHTAGHIAYHLPSEKTVFVGDTLFAMGCGRLFEGTAEQMFDNMQRLAALPDETAVYCAHEYTLSNGRYALVAEPNNEHIVARMNAVEAARARGDATVPTSISLEKATNPFMRAKNAQELAERRAAKDSFQ